MTNFTLYVHRSEIDNPEKPCTICEVTIYTPDWAGMGNDTVKFELDSGEYLLNDLISKAKEVIGEESAFDWMGTPRYVRTNGEQGDVNTPIKITKNILIEVIGRDTEFALYLSGNGDTDYQQFSITLPKTITWAEIDAQISWTPGYYMVTSVTLPDGTVINRSESNNITIGYPGDIAWELDLYGSYNAQRTFIVFSNINNLSITIPLPENYPEFIQTNLNTLTTQFREEARKQEIPDAEFLEAKTVWVDYELHSDKTGWAELGPDYESNLVILQGDMWIPAKFTAYRVNSETGAEEELGVIEFPFHQIPGVDFKAQIEQLVGIEYVPTFIWFELVPDEVAWPPESMVELPYYFDTDFPWGMWIECQSRAGRTIRCRVEDDRYYYQGTFESPQITTTDAIYNKLYDYISSPYYIDEYRIEGIARTFNGSEHQTLVLPDLDTVTITYSVGRG